MLTFKLLSLLKLAFEKTGLRSLTSQTVFSVDGHRPQEGTVQQFTSSNAVFPF